MLVFSGRRIIIGVFATSLLLFAAYLSFSVKQSSLLESLGWAPSLACSDHHCLDTTDGLRIMDGHVKHMVGIWNLVEGMGHPGGTTFVPVAIGRLNPATHEWPPMYHDAASERFLKLARDFLMEGSSMDMELDLLLTRIVGILWRSKTVRSDVSLSVIHFHIQPFGNKLNRTRQILMDIESSQSRDRVSNGFRQLQIEKDKIFNSTISELMAEITTTCKTALSKSENLPSAALNVSVLGSEMALGLDGELARVKDALLGLPWWDTWTLTHWEGRSRTTRYRAYLKFFEAEERTFRALADASAAIHQNVVGLRDYCVWYMDESTSNLIHEDGQGHGTTRPVTAKSIAQDIESLLNRLEITWHAGQPNGSPGWPPRAVHLPPADRIS
ncbi:hypothetical protein DFH06DRAFT_1234242 [Mycena polygramma]|nr:hypothetical protein DFH06DRAFT_1234242 [Mycena polygramma]